MPAYEALAQYNPLLVLLLGSLTFAGTLGVGLALLRGLRMELISPWREAVAAMLGVSSLSLLLQMLGMARLSSRQIMGAAWLSFAVVGSLVLVLRARRGMNVLHRNTLDWIERITLGFGLFAAGLNLLLAMAPSTKMDEIYYQMIVSARMALDGALVFYLQPWPAAVLPQMGYGIAGAPLHGFGVQDGPNVLSWCLGALLAWLGARLVFQETGSRILGLIAGSAMVIGLYPSVYHTTGGPHALSDLAIATSVLAVVFPDRLFRNPSPVRYIATLSFCCMVGTATKISLGPLMAATFAIGFVRVVRANPARLPAFVAVASAPWLIFYLPICIYTFLHSGSPFGPMLADLFAPSVYGDRVQTEMEGSRARGDEGLIYALRGYVIHYPAIFWVATIAAVSLRSDDSSRRFLVGGLLLLQVVVVAALLPHYARYLAGLHHALLVVGLVQIAPLVRGWLARPGFALPTLALLLLPWLGVQTYRAVDLVPISLGIAERDDYYRSYIALWDDIQELDRILPEDAVLYTRENLPSIYFPRPVFMHPKDLPEARPAFALLGTTPKRSVEEIDCSYMRLPEGCRFGEIVYSNPKALYKAYRTPGRAPAVSRIEVREIVELPPVE